MFDPANLEQQLKEHGVVPADAPSLSGAGDGDLPPALDQEDILSSIYYDVPLKDYLMRNRSGRWLRLTDRDLKRMLCQRGYSAKREEGNPLSEVEEAIVYVQDYQDVDFAGAIAGRFMGFYEENGGRILVTKPPTLIEPVRGDGSIVRRLLSTLFESPDVEVAQAQAAIFHGWIRGGMLAVRNGEHSQGQALVLCGEAGCGKSFVQHHIITPLMGGRSAKAARYMTGGTDFNAELCGAEHLILEDEFVSTRFDKRSLLAANIKQMCVGNKIVSLHPKHRDAFNVSVLWRISISVNNDPEAMMVLPPLTDHVADKLILLRCYPADFQMPFKTTEEKRLLEERVKAELPAYAWWLLNEFELPESLRSERYGVASYHNPELAEALHGLSPEAHLIKLIDEGLMWIGSKEWRGTAEQVKRELLNNELTRRETTQLLDRPGNTAKYLGRLAKRTDGRVRSTRTASLREWIITMPSRGKKSLKNAEDLVS